MKLSIIGGGGTLGSTAAFVIAQQNLVEEICLIDIKENIAKSHEMDMGQAVAGLSRTKISSGGMDALAGSQLVMITVGIPETKVASRVEYLDGNIKIIKDLSGKIKQLAPDAIIITATNPLDVMNTALLHYTGYPAERLIGFSQNDSFRFRWAIAKVLHIDINTVDAIVLGEHGEEQCPIFSHIKVDGEKVDLSSEQREEVAQIISDWFTEYQSLNSGRTTGWLSGVNLANYVRAIVNDTKERIPCSAIGSDGISIGQLASIGKNGIEQIVDLDMDASEAKQFTAAKEKIRNLVNEYINE